MRRRDVVRETYTENVTVGVYAQQQFGFNDRSS
jgi:hypothetical protein